MSYNLIGYFVLPADALEQVTPLYGEFVTSSGELHDDTWVLGNKLYRHAQDRAVSQWRYGHPLAYDAYVGTRSYLYRHAETERDMTFARPAECPDIARSIDAIAAWRGGHEALIQQIAKLTYGEVPIEIVREVYVALRVAVATAVELRAGLVCRHYVPGAERDLAEQRARVGPRKSRLQLVGLPPDMPPPPPLSEDMRALVEASRNCTEENAYTYSWTEHRLSMVPEPYISDIMALARQGAALMDEDPDGNIEKYLALCSRAEAIGREEWERWFELEFKGEVSAWKAIYAALTEYRPGCIPDAMAFSPAVVRELLAVWRGWQESVGGRDAAVGLVADRSYGRDRDMTRRIYDGVFALFQHGVDRGCGLIDCQLHQMG